MSKIAFKNKTFGDSLTSASDLLIDKIEGSNAGDVQGAIAELYENILRCVNDINEYKTQLDGLLAGASSAYGFATLDANGKIPTSQLPSYMDDVVECETYDDLPAVGEPDKIYHCKDTEQNYRWGGTVWVNVTNQIGIGETASSAYRGDRGKIAYEHAISDHAPTTLASETSPGLMGALDKKKLDGLMDVKEIKYADYLALSEEEKNNGTTYYITDLNMYGDCTVDQELKADSSNPVSGKAVYEELQKIKELISK